ncbi:alpha/beta fold hydrolase [Janibacter limosus]|uniref:Alpha/beta fold hydrolase n=1 Tax=Janibacter limosus TaxID=53458 RepID=A0AC61U2W8_9MICO|nr:alpha/beta fold hydrolase [Janibacter limosus]UUZ44344.1 alpha/beta fold hydrolase [Janibacter limosus]
MLLLHGWPRDGQSWSQVAEQLNAAGFRTFAPHLRGTTDSANPPHRRDFGTSALRSDVTAMVQQIGQPVHLVGHDWGAAPAWDVATHDAGLLRSLTAVSVPHPATFLRSLFTSTQGASSWYMYFFQLPWVPELALDSTRFMTRALMATGQRRELAAQDARRNGTHALRRGGLHWYRGAVTELPDFGSPTPVPVLQVWSDGDTAVRRRAVEGTHVHAAGTYRLKVLEGVSHWIPQEAPDELATELIAHFHEADTQQS